MVGKKKAKKKASKRAGRPNKEYSQAQRLLQLVELMQQRRQVTIAELTESFGINRRTVQRDMNALSEIYDVEEGERTANNEKTFRLKPGARADALRLTITEMIALYMGRNLFAFTDGTDLREAMDSLYDKLQSRLCARNATVKETLPKKLFCTTGFPKSYRAKDDVLNDVLTGLIDQKKLRIRYRRPGKDAYEDTLRPYTLVVHNHALYLIAYSERAEDRRMYAVERIAASKWRGMGTFDYPEDYDPQDMLAPAFGISTGHKSVSIKLRFSPEVAPYVASRQWHPSMEAKSRKDGSLDVSLEAPVAEELLHWVTGYGGEVSVLSPKSLKEAIRARHRAGGRA